MPIEPRGKLVKRLGGSQRQRDGPERARLLAVQFHLPVGVDPPNVDDGVRSTARVIGSVSPGTSTGVDAERSFKIDESTGSGTLTVRTTGVVSATQGGTEFPGSIYVQPDLPHEQVAAFMADNGDPVADWLGPFLHDDARGDVRRKLGQSGAVERHAFVKVAAFLFELAYWPLRRL